MGHGNKGDCVGSDRVYRLLMENSTKKSGCVVIPKRKRSLDLKSLYECRSSEVGGSKPKDSVENEQKDVKKKKRKNRKELPLSSLEPDAKKKKCNRNGVKSDIGFREKLDVWSKELHGISFTSGDFGSPFNIPKRLRGSVGRKKLESDQDSESLRLTESVDLAGAFKAEVSKSEEKGGPTNQLIRPGTFSEGKDGISKSRVRGKIVGSHTKLKKVGSDDAVNRVGALKAEVTKYEDKGCHSDQSARPVTLSPGNNAMEKDLVLKKKSNRKRVPKSTMNSGRSDVKSKMKVRDDEGVDHVGEFEDEVSKSEDKGGPHDRPVSIVGKVVDLGKKSKRKADSKSTVNSSISNVKLKKNVEADEAINHVGAFESEDKGGSNEQSVRPVALSLGDGVAGKLTDVNKKSKRKGDSNMKTKKNVGDAEIVDCVEEFEANVPEDKAEGKSVGVNKKSNRKAGHKSTTNSSTSNVKLMKRVGADEASDRVGAFEDENTNLEDKGGPNDQSVRSVTFSAGNNVAVKVAGLNTKSKRKGDPKSTMNSSSSSSKLKKKVGVDEAIDHVGEFEANVTKSEDEGGLIDQSVRSVTFSAGNDVVEKFIGVNKNSKRKANPKSTAFDTSSNVELKKKVEADEAKIIISEEEGGPNDESVRSVTRSASNNVAGKDVGVNKKSKRKADPKSTMNFSNSNVKLKKKVGDQEAVDCTGASEAECIKSEDKDDISNLRFTGKVVGSNTKPKRKVNFKSSIGPSSSNKKLKKTGADGAVVRVGASKSEVTKPQDKGGSDDELVGPVTLSAGKDGVSNSRLAGKFVGSNTKSNRKADAKSTVNSSSSNAKNRKVRADDVKGKESSLVVNNGVGLPKKRPSNSRKKKDLVVGGDGVEGSVKKSEPAVVRSIPDNLFVNSLDEDDDDEEENLEQNAAMMLSSRFDPSCTGFASKRNSQTVDELSFPVSSSPRDSVSRQAKSLSGVESDSGDDDNNRELRPRGGDKGKGVLKKRRHFYEIPAKDLDPSWVLSRRIKIFWPLDESWYYGYVTDFHSEAKLHHLKYDDGEEEWVNLEEENFRLLLLRSEVPGKGKSRKRSTAVKQTAPSADDDNCVGDDDSEPIASWLASQFQYAKALKRRKISQGHLPLFSPLSSEKTDDSNGNPDALKLSSEDTLLVRGTVDKSHSKQEVYVRKKFQKKSIKNTIVSIGEKTRGSAVCCDKQLWLYDDRSNSTLNDVLLLESNEFRIQICLPLLPYPEFYRGIGFFRLIHDMFMLQHGVIVTTSRAVFLEMLFVDSNLGLRSFLFEGCLVRALAIVFLISTFFSRSDDNRNDGVTLPSASIRFQLSSVYDVKKQHVFTFHSFSRRERSNWLYVESKILRRCLLIKQLSVSECTYDNIREIECGILQPCKSCVGSELFSREDFRNESERGISPMGVSMEAVNTENLANVPRFTPSFSAAPNFVLSLHLRSLIEHGSAAPNLQHEDRVSSPENSGDGDEPIVECSHLIEHENRQSDSEASTFRGLSSYQQDSETGVFLASNATENTNSSDKIEKGLPSDQQADMPSARKDCISRQTSDASWDVHDDDFVLNSIAVGPKSSSKRRKSSTISSLLGQHSPVSADSQPNFMPDGFSNGPKKPRTQVQYTLPFAGYDFSTRQEASSPRSIPCKRIRRASLKRTSDGSDNNHKNIESLACSANVLVTHGDRGWRECGAHLVLEFSDHSEWRLAVKLSGVTKFSYKVTHVLQPCSTNRYSHAVIWKGGKDWVLEFPDRSQWMLFKEMYEECYNRNIRAASVKNIPIPGVRPVDEGGDYGDEVPFVRNPATYFRQVQTDAEMAMDPSRILYDMDIDDERWLATHRNCTDKAKYEEITEEFFEMAMDMFEKVSYAQRRDNLTEAEIEELSIVIGSVEAAKLVYQHWRMKREKMCMPLIRHLQPPPWQRYQKELKEWENNVSKSIQEKLPPPEKPPMFAFCFKPRGLDVPNRAPKQRSHRRLSVSGLHHATTSGDHSLLVSGRRSNGHAYRDEKALYASTIHDSFDISPSPHPSTRVLSSRDAHFTLTASVSEWKVNNNNRNKSHQNKRQKKRRDDNNGVQHWDVGPYEVSNPNRYCFDRPHDQGGPPKRLDISDLHEFHVRDALGASKHARVVAKAKRERAQRLFCKADFFINRAVSALMQAEAIKDSFRDSDGVVS